MVCFAVLSFLNSIVKHNFVIPTQEESHNQSRLQREIFDLRYVISRFARHDKRGGFSFIETFYCDELCAKLSLKFVIPTQEESYNQSLIRENVFDLRYVISRCARHDNRGDFESLYVICCANSLRSGLAALDMTNEGISAFPQLCHSDAGGIS